MKQRLVEEGAILALAVQFLTRLPLPFDPGFTPERLAATPRWYPVVGLLVGAIVALAFWLSALVFPPTLAALLSTAVGLLVTGCFHEDGFADCCDGLGGGTTTASALEIMRDSRLGTYGAAGLGLMLGGKILVLGALPLEFVPAVLIAGHAASRGSAVLVIATSTYLRPEGTGKPVATGINSAGLAFTLVVSAAALAFLCLVAGWAVLGGVAGLVAGHLGMRSRFETRLGGYTGDCLGGVQQTSEIGFYLGMLACL